MHLYRRFFFRYISCRYTETVVCAGSCAYRLLLYTRWSEKHRRGREQKAHLIGCIVKTLRHFVSFVSYFDTLVARFVVFSGSQITGT